MAKSKIPSRVLMVGGLLSLSAVMVAPVSAAPVDGILLDGFTSEFPGREAEKVFDGVTQTTDGTVGMWLGTSSAGESVTLFLNGAYSNSTLTVHNYNESAGGGTVRGFNSVGVEVSTDYGATFSSVPSVTTFAQAPGSTPYAGQSFSLGSAAVTHVRVTGNTNHGDGGFSGLTELTIDSPTLATVQVTGATVSAVSSEFAGREADNTLDGNRTSTDPTTAWLSSGAPGEDTPSITWDMGEVVAMSHMNVWNYNEGAAGIGRGVQDFELFGSTDGITFTQLTDPTDLDTTFTIDQATGEETGTNRLLNDEVDLGGETLRYLRIDVLTNYGDNSFAGLNEVEFYAIPEPASLALMALGSLLIVGRRRA